MQGVIFLLPLALGAILLVREHKNYRDLKLILELVAHLHQTITPKRVERRVRELNPLVPDVVETLPITLILRPVGARGE